MTIEHFCWAYKTSTSIHLQQNTNVYSYTFYHNNLELQWMSPFDYVINHGIEENINIGKSTQKNLNYISFLGILEKNI